MAHLGQDDLDYGAYSKAVSELSPATLKAWIDAGVQMRVHIAKPGDMIFIPTGWTGVEQTRADQSVIYGFRKSFLQKGDASKSNYRACTVLFERAQRNTERMETILKLMQPSGPSGSTGNAGDGLPSTELPVPAPVAAGEPVPARVAEGSQGNKEPGKA